MFAAGDRDGRNPSLGIGDLEKRLERCYLHFIGRRYWALLEKHGFLQGAVGQGPICALATHYQFFREVLLALELGGTFVLLSDERNLTFYRKSPREERGLLPLLRSFMLRVLQERVVMLSLQQVLESIEASGRHAWVGEFERKYGLA